MGPHLLPHADAGLELLGTFAAATSCSLLSDPVMSFAAASDIHYEHRVEEVPGHGGEREPACETVQKHTVAVMMSISGAFGTKVGALPDGDHGALMVSRPILVVWAGVCAVGGTYLGLHIVFFKNNKDNTKYVFCVVFFSSKITNFRPTIETLYGIFPSSPD